MNNYKELLEEVSDLARKQGRDPSTLKLVVVSKNRAVDEIQSVYESGCLDFGENRVQEALEKLPELPEEIRWHFIGTLQKNKINHVLGKFALIHSVDSLELAEKISKKSIEIGIKTPILLQVNTSGEQSKQGFTEEGCFKEFEKLLELSGVKIEGLMTMAPFVEDERVIRKTFSSLRELAVKLRSEGGEILQLSMGMSHDYRIAIEEGATIIRVGRKVFLPSLS